VRLAGLAVAAAWAVRHGAAPLLAFGAGLLLGRHLVFVWLRRRPAGGTP
jgi:hypothetical protein